MKNKLLIAGIALVSGFTLASCNGNSEDYSTLREVVLTDIQADVKKDLNLFYDVDAADHNAKLLTTSTATDVVKVYVAADAKASLFVYNCDIKGFFDAHKEKSKSVSLSCVSATGALYESEQTSLVNTLFDATNGVKSVLDVTFKDSIYETSTYVKSVDCQEEYAKYAEDNKSVTYLSIVYIPTYVVHTKDGQDKLRDYVLVPIYHEFTTDGKISDVKVVDFEKYLDETATFKIKVTE